jgi:formate dehydrogenase
MDGWSKAVGTLPIALLEGMNVGTVAAGRIGLAVMRRLKPFGLKLHYTDKHRLPKEVEEELGATYHSTVESLVKVCDVVTINAPMHSNRRRRRCARRVRQSLYRRDRLHEGRTASARW